MGADDYITKPFSQRLLLERVRAVLRRAEQMDQQQVKPPSILGIWLFILIVIPAPGKIWM